MQKQTQLTYQGTSTCAQKTRINQTNKHAHTTKINKPQQSNKTPDAYTKDSNIKHTNKLFKFNHT